jgi:hypothetical protein
VTTPVPRKQAEPKAEPTDAALDAADHLYDLMCSPSSYGMRVDAKIALKKAILALAAQPVAGHQGGDNNG